jgi:hypothetical protein
MSADIGVVMQQNGQPIKQWKCPFCGHIEYTSIFQTESPRCPACINSGKVYTWEETEEYYDVKELFH